MIFKPTKFIEWFLKKLLCLALISVTDDLRALVIKLEGRVACLEKGGSAGGAPKAAPAPAAADDDDDDDVDLFGR